MGIKMAKRSKGFGKHNQEAEDFDRRELKRFAQEIADGPLNTRVSALAIAPEGLEKMSEVLGDFVSPFLALVDTDDDRRMVIKTAVLAWNLSLLAPIKRSLMLENSIVNICPSDNLLDRENLRKDLNQMITYKLQSFADNQRKILDVQISDYGEQFHLSVASTLMVEK
jgi:hypothetical protein